MARTNKYASLNFNDIYEKKTKSPSGSSPLSTPNKPILSNSRIHGNMLVLTRPSPKVIPQPPPPQQHPPPDQTRFEPDPISLRPLGRTGSATPLPLSPEPSPIQNKDKELSVSPKPDKFVPPHLRPGFQKQLGHRQGHFGSPNPYGEDGRPNTGGGYERMRRGGESDPVELNRPGSSGTRPSSRGLWYDFHLHEVELLSEDEDAKLCWSK